MDLCKNMLLEHIGTTAERKIDRVLWISSEGSLAVLIQINDKGALPRFCTTVEIDDRFKDGELRSLQSDPLVGSSRDEENASESHRRHRDKAWALIAPVIQMPDADAFDGRKRGPVIERIYQSARTSKWLIYAHLRRYWQGDKPKTLSFPSLRTVGREEKIVAPQSRREGDHEI